MRRVIRLGDKTSHGGTLVSAAGNYTIMGKQVARIGDVCTCPIKGHTNCTIVEGDPYWTIDGRNVALEGHKTSCGATLISSCSELGRSYEGHAGAANGQLIQSPPPTVDTNAANKVMIQAGDYDEFFIVRDEDGAPIPNYAYRIKTASGGVLEGVTDAAGRTSLAATGERPVYLDLALTRPSKVEHAK